jgi:hypothetical protein
MSAENKFKWRNVTCHGHCPAYQSKTCVVFIDGLQYTVVDSEGDDGALIHTEDWALVVAYVNRRDAYAGKRMNTTQGR